MRLERAPRDRERGLTLLGSLAAIAITAIMATVSLITFGHVRQHDVREAARQEVRNVLEEAIGYVSRQESTAQLYAWAQDQPSQVRWTTGAVTGTDQVSVHIGSQSVSVAAWTDTGRCIFGLWVASPTSTWVGSSAVAVAGAGRYVGEAGYDVASAARCVALTPSSPAPPDIAGKTLWQPLG